MHIEKQVNASETVSFVSIFWLIQVFGDVRDVSVTEDLLVVTLYNRTVRYYSFAWILENVSIRMQCE